MCGIVGIIGATEKPIEILVRAMRDVFPYRGPDAEGLWVNPSSTVAFGHRRLSIIDVSSAGNQPMSDSEGELWITYNGEIYNYIELGRELERKGHTFRTRTDTEVVLVAFQEWGWECLNRFNGMWAFAIWDEKRSRLFLARDRLGIKPLYYYQDGDTFYFASEIKAILKILDRRPDIDAPLIDAYMSFGYVPGENTLFRGIKRLPPGHLLETGGAEIIMSKYWDLSFQENTALGFDYCVQQSRSILEDAVTLRLRSDVPLGIFLSGGLDSSAVVGLLAKENATRLKTFSVAYDFGPGYNETPYARQVAEKFHTDHYEIFISPDEFRDFIPEFVWRMDEPVTEAAAISLFFVSRLAKSHVTVVLSGEGADEVFAGYDLYRYMVFLNRYRKILGPKASRKLANFSKKHFPTGSKIAKYLELGSEPLEDRYRGISMYDTNYKAALYDDHFKLCLAYGRDNHPLRFFLEGIFNSSHTWDPLSQMLYFDLKTWLVDDLLIKADRMSMGASLELRVPFLDYRLVEFSARMPSSYKLHNGTGKFILKKMMEDILPRNIIQRKKMGFPSPLKKMLEKNLRGYAEDLLLSPSAIIGTYFKRDQMERVLKEHISRIMDHHRLIWQLIVLETWMQVFRLKTWQL